MNKNKNQAMLIKAFYKVFQDKKNIKLIIAGGGAEYKNLKNLIKYLNLEDQVVLYGRITRNKVRDLLHKSNVFVLSSKYETFGVVLIEALAAGLPVIATKCGGPESIIRSNNIGYLSEIDERDLAKKMLKIYHNYNEFDTNYLIKYVEKNFSEQAVVKKILNIYKKVLINYH